MMKLFYKRPTFIKSARTVRLDKLYSFFTPALYNYTQSYKYSTIRLMDEPTILDLWYKQFYILQNKAI